MFARKHKQPENEFDAHIKIVGDCNCLSLEFSIPNQRIYIDLRTAAAADELIQALQDGRDRV